MVTNTDHYAPTYASLHTHTHTRVLYNILHKNTYSIRHLNCRKLL